MNVYFEIVESYLEWGTIAIFLIHVKVRMPVVRDKYISGKNMAHVKSFRVCVKIDLIC